ncbi:hypothetical protein COCSUDRAFT_64833 [Coccomyxa subellipsoidea C-169]|uniref:ASCH domain-containing protein n=1 Tax=Coccomyxa subellipsoidea (strain C-169) TaxID=574566 RepID=I0Z558_COCSC|nr:hypothetical protein COCSUDRAFT_64833 [Coccomyxa subellipsoidea C-169]EIE25777.1 hypothetical protein COCSUDRAFT_64833 [Coccomyxa subellipsoidea C-169]|eukprot:XP_005650321.1 hypothetical protein COCSUDRAFT_64833 [Coccomyxa subellipsoidea C-169]
MAALEAASHELCISLHQPWASLLVYGIKRIEGRDWPSKYRGRLWIHATSRRPDAQTVQELEDFYRKVHDMDGHKPEFPAKYPTGALIGCVSLVDVLTAEQVEAWQLPASVKEEVGSPFAFLCEDTRIMTAPICMRGWPRLWPLPAETVRRAELFLLTPPQLGCKGFRWSAFERPKDLLQQDLPVNPARNRFKERYGSPLQIQSGHRKSLLPHVLDGEGTLEAPKKRLKIGERILWNVDDAKRITFT